MLIRYTRLLRDEVLADWCEDGLHVHCHIKGHADWWLAPAFFRLFIFRREMTLVLDAIRFADSPFLDGSPGAPPLLFAAAVSAENAHSVERRGWLLASPAHRLSFLVADRWGTPVFVHYHNSGEGAESVVESWGSLGATLDRCLALSHAHGRRSALLLATSPPSQIPRDAANPPSPPRVAGEACSTPPTL